MEPKIIKMASGREFEIPLFDPLVGAHFNTASSYVGELLRQTNDEQIYAKMFAGKTGLIFLDLGANMGVVSIYAADSCARIVSVEPAPATFSVLKAMTWSFPNINPVCAALCPVDGPCKFFQNDVNSTASSTVNTYGTEVMVPGLRLSTILHQNQLEHVDVCKIDVEGAEGESLTLAELQLVRPIVDSYYVETHNCPKTAWEHKLGEFVGNMARLGYHQMEVRGMTVYSRKP